MIKRYKLPEPITGPQLREIIGIIPSQLTHMYTSDLVPPSLSSEEALRSGALLIFSFTDLVHIGIMQQVRVLGFRKNVLRKVIDYLNKYDPIKYGLKQNNYLIITITNKQLLHKVSLVSKKKVLLTLSEGDFTSHHVIEYSRRVHQLYKQAWAELQKIAGS